MKHLTINRSKWWRGCGQEGSMLLNSETGLMCCLGFQAIACGFTSEDIAGIPTPEDLLNKVLKAGSYRPDVDAKGMVMFATPERTAWGTQDFVNNAIGDTLMAINDDTHITDEERQQRISDIFLGMGIFVSFTD